MRHRAEAVEPSREPRGRYPEAEEVVEQHEIPISVGDRALELLHELEVYNEQEVAEVFAHVAAAVGTPNAEGFDLEEHVLGVVANVMRGRWRQRHESDAWARRLGRVREQLWLADEDTLLAVSPAAAAVVGYRPHELIGHSLERLRPDGHDWTPRIQRTYDLGADEGMVLVRHRDGRQIALEFVVRVVELAERELRFGRTRLLVAAAATTTAAVLLLAPSAARAHVPGANSLVDGIQAMSWEAAP